MCPGDWSGVCPKHLRSDGLLLGYSTLLSTKNEQRRFKRERRAALEAHAAPGPRGRCRRPSLRAPCVSPPSPPSPCGHLPCWPQSGSGRAPAAGSCRSPRVSRPLPRGEAAILTVGPSRAENGPPGEGQAGPWPRPTGRPPPPALSSPGPSPSSFSARPRPRDAKLGCGTPSRCPSIPREGVRVHPRAVALARLPPCPGLGHRSCLVDVQVHAGSIAEVCLRPRGGGVGVREGSSSGQVSWWPWARWKEARLIFTVLASSGLMPRAS